MKKLISIGVALALLTMMVMPALVAAQEGCPEDSAYTYPTTFAKIPFAILGSGLYLMEDILNALVDAGLLPASLDWLPDLMQPIGDWTMGPLSWTVDMLAWGMGMVGGVIGAADCILAAVGVDLGDITLAPVGEVFNLIACGLFTPFSCNVSGVGWDPCGAAPCG